VVAATLIGIAALLNKTEPTFTEIDTTLN